MFALVPTLALAVALQAGGDAAPPPAEETPASAAQQPDTGQSAPDEAEVMPASSAGTASLLGGRSLGVGGAALLGQAGYPFLGLAYAQGLSEQDDLGAMLELEWATSELVLAGTWRRAVWRSDSLGLALRAHAGLYTDFGAKFIHSDNTSDTGVQAAPGLAFSADLGSGILSFGGEVAGTWTFAKGTGWILTPRAGVAFELPLYGDLTVGARADLGYRAFGGKAPAAGARSGQTLVGLELLLGCRLL